MKYIIGLIVAIVVIGGGAYYFMSAGGSGTVATSTEDSVSTDQATGTGSLKALLSMSGAQKCEVNHNSTVSDSQGVVYVSGGKLRGDFSSTASGQTFQTHLIVRDNKIHTWVDGVPTGFSAPVDMTASAGTSNQGLSVNEAVDYKCESWRADESMFELPVGLQFMTVGQ